MYKSIAFFSFFFALATASQGDLNINVRPTASGQYDILVDGEVWFPGSTHSVGLHNYPDLKVIKKTTTSVGKDGLGDHSVFSTTGQLAYRLLQFFMFPFQRWNFRDLFFQ